MFELSKGRELLVRVAAGDCEALAAFREATSAWVRDVAKRYSFDDDVLADDVTSDVYVQVWRDAARFDPTRGNIWSWLSMLTRSRSLDRIRARRRRRREEECEGAEATPVAADSCPLAAALIEERRGRVRAALACLRPELREVLVAGYYEGRSQSQIAADTGLPLGTVKTRTRIALRQLREELRMLDPVRDETGLDAAVPRCA